MIEATSPKSSSILPHRKSAGGRYSTAILPKIGTLAGLPVLRYHCSPHYPPAIAGCESIPVNGRNSFTMLKFFPHTTDQTASGSPTYALNILRINYEYFLTGLVEIDYTPKKQLVLLVCEGKDAGAFHVTETRTTQIDPSEISTLWTEGEGRIRFINLPRVALRAARQLLEWSPPAQSLRAENREIVQDYIQTCQSQRSTGLFHLIWPRSEGYLSMRDGNILQTDSVFSTPSNTEAGSHCLAQILENLDSPARISYLESKPSTASDQQQTLRIALTDFLEGILSQYASATGPGQTKAMVIDLNNAMRAQSWYLHIERDQLLDTHVFADVYSAANAYQTLIKHLAIHMYNSMGIRQAQKLLKYAFQSLEGSLQQIIQKYALLPTVINTN